MKAQRWLWLALAWALAGVWMARGEEAAATAPELKATRWSERVDKKSGKRLLTVWLKNESMADFKGSIAIVIRGKGEREEQRSEVAAAVPVHQERAVEVVLGTDASTRSKQGGFTGLTAEGSRALVAVQQVASVEVESVSAAIAAK